MPQHLSCFVQHHLSSHFCWLELLALWFRANCCLSSLLIAVSPCFHFLSHCLCLGAVENAHDKLRTAKNQAEKKPMEEQQGKEGAHL